MTVRKLMLVMALCGASGMAAAGPVGSSVDFSNGTQGWTGMQPLNGNGGSGIDTSMGNGAPALRTVLENFGVSFTNSTNQNYLGNYGALGSVTIGLDVIANSIRYQGNEVSRHLVLELRDYDNVTGGMPYNSVWYDFGVINSSLGWQNLSVTIGDTTASALPQGWGGYGSPDDAAGPGLPGGVSFADVLAGVDEMAFTTLVPGWSYGFTDFDVAIDNISVTAVPEPASYALLLGGLGMMGWASRRRSRKARPA